MGSNRFGQILTFTTWGESHGKALGVVVDGCPANLPLTEEMINKALSLRRPGYNPHTSPRKEEDLAQIFSGVFQGKTTGAPISIIIFNEDVDSTKYDSIDHLYRPGHANFTYLHKYGIFDHRGGGRSSARETVCRVAAGAVAKELLLYFGIDLCGYIKSIGNIKADIPSPSDLKELKQKTVTDIIFCPDKESSMKMQSLIEKTQKEGDSLSGSVELITSNLPIGLGDPVYEKLEANLAKAMLSIPASKGIHFGEDLKADLFLGSEYQDVFIKDEKGTLKTKTNHAGGTLGGISNGMPLIFKVFFKPTSSIRKPLQTVTTDGKHALFELPEGSRHDPCVAIRAVPVIEAMAALVLADALLVNRSSSL